MDWYRAYHGMPNDPKLAVLAARAGVRRGEVLEVWVYLLDLASQNEPRGSVAGLDTEEAAWVLEMDEERVRLIVDAFASRGMIADGELPAWEKRQPLREDDNAAERMRAYRERKRNVTPVTESYAPLHTVTQGHAESHTVTTDKIRLEEIRGEENTHTQPRVSVFPTRTPTASDLQSNDGGISPRFDELWGKYPRQVDRDSAAHDWVSYVTVANESAVFACLDNYLLSADVARGAIMNLGSNQNSLGWIARCAKDHWKSRWPARASPAVVSKSEDMLARALKAGKEMGLR